MRSANASSGLCPPFVVLFPHSGIYCFLACTHPNTLTVSIKFSLRFVKSLELASLGQKLTLQCVTILFGLYFGSCRKFHLLGPISGDHHPVGGGQQEHEDPGLPGPALHRLGPVFHSDELRAQL